MLPKITLIQPSGSHGRLVVNNPTWYVYEQKLDGWRCLSSLENGTVKLESKHNLLYKGFHHIRQAILDLGFTEAIFDGELACLDDKGNPDFDALVRRSRPQYYFVFDVLWLNGFDLRPLPLLERKQYAEAIVRRRGSALRYVEHFTPEDANELLVRIMRNNWEGAIAKLKDRPYKPDIKGNWVKILNRTNDHRTIGNRWRPRN